MSDPRLKLIREINNIRDVAQELQELAREHAIAAHVDEALETYETELYDQDSETGVRANIHLASPRAAGPNAAEGHRQPRSPSIYDQDAEGGVLGPICDEPFHLWQRFEICTVCGSAALVVYE
jgi:hypothetical protein